MTKTNPNLARLVTYARQRGDDFTLTEDGYGALPETVLDCTVTDVAKIDRTRNWCLDNALRYFCPYGDHLWYYLSECLVGDDADDFSADDRL